MSNQDFERVLDSIRGEDPGVNVVEAAAERVRAKLDMRAVDLGGRLNSCEDFRALADAYREGGLSEARHMLVEDHLHSCVMCRRFFRGEQKASVVTMPSKRSVVGVALPWAIAAAVLVVAGFTLPEYFNVLFAPSGARASVASVDGELYKVAGNGLTLLTAGSPIAENEQVRTAKGSRAVLRLRDGSMVWNALWPGPAGMFNGRTNSPFWPVLCRKGGGTMCGAGCCAVSAALAIRMRAGRSGKVTSPCTVMIVSICLSRSW